MYTLPSKDQSIKLIQIIVFQTNLGSFLKDQFSAWIKCENSWPRMTLFRHDVSYRFHLCWTWKASYRFYQRKLWMRLYIIITLNARYNTIKVNQLNNELCNKHSNIAFQTLPLLWLLQYFEHLMNDVVSSNMLERTISRDKRIDKCIDGYRNESFEVANILCHLRMCFME